MTDPAAASLFTMALGLQAPWEVVEVAFDPDAGRIDFEVAFAAGARRTAGRRGCRSMTLCSARGGI
jgi:hypothetical protein